MLYKYGHNEEPCQAFIRQDKIANLLFEFLKGNLKHDITFTKLADNYFYIDEILCLPEFKAYNCKYNDIVDAIHADSLLRFSVRGSKVRLKPPELNKDRDVIISKKLAFILRHGAEKSNLNYEPGGYLYLDDVLALKVFQGITVEEIEKVINANEKKRFELSRNPDNGRLRLRAFQGHSVTIDGLGLVLITNPHDYPVVIHGTYFRNWEHIKKQGLLKMARTHIHFAPGLPGDSGVISGMRSSAEIIIYIDLKRAMNDNFKFFISENNVILCEGNAEGCLPPLYFLSAYQRRPHLQLELDDQQQSDQVVLTPECDNSITSCSQVKKLSI